MDMSPGAKRLIIASAAVVVQIALVLAIIPAKAVMTKGGTDVFITVTAAKPVPDVPGNPQGSGDSSARSDETDRSSAASVPESSSSARPEASSGATLPAQDATGQAPLVPNTPGVGATFYLTFEISEVPLASFANLADVSRSTTVYTPLDQENKHWEIAGKIGPQNVQENGQVSVRGVIAKPVKDAKGYVYIQYGVEQFSSQSYSLDDLQLAVDKKQVLAWMLVKPDGTAVLKGLRINNRPAP